MEINIFDFIARMEEDLARFYGFLKTVSRFRDSEELFNFMIRHSQGHAHEAESLTTRYVRPEMNRDFFLKLNDQIKKSLLEEVRNAASLPEAIQKIARTEEQVGRMYEALALHYKKLSEYYQAISEEMMALSREEMTHRDMVLAELKKYHD